MKPDAPVTSTRVTKKPCPHAVEFFNRLRVIVCTADIQPVSLERSHVHLPIGFFWQDGGFEYPLMWGLIALAIFFRGGGRLSLDRLIRREF